MNEKKRILVLDDDEVTVDTLCASFRQHGFDAMGMWDKGKALIELGTIKPDLIVSDIRSPGVDGLEFLGLLKADSRFRHIPVLVISGYLRGCAEKALFLGAHGALGKPYDFLAVLAIVREALHVSET